MYSFKEQPFYTDEMAEQGQRKLTKQERVKNLLVQTDFSCNAFHIFYKATELATTTDTVNPYLLNQILHSILFLGNINAARYLPSTIFKEEQMYRKTMECFPQPFEKYRTHVAQRTPFSYFLELVVNCAAENEDKVRAILSDTLSKCKGSENEYTLISSAICICEVSGRSYYGGSLSCPGNVEREIMTAVSCFHVWDNYVSSAVLDVFPEDKTEPRFPRGNMKLPSLVECRAYAIENLSEVKAPCARCSSLYSMPRSTRGRNYPGNCAETEAISNLLKNEEEVKVNTTMQGEVFNTEYIQKHMRTYFKSKIEKMMQSRSRKNRDSYSIDRIFD